MMKTAQYQKMRSLRFLLPFQLLLFAIIGCLIMYVFEVRLHEARFEADFNRNQTLRDTRIQADVERWVLRNDMDMVQSIFAELGVIQELKMAVYLDTANTVLAGARRSDIGRPLDLKHLGLNLPDLEHLLKAMQTARRTRSGISFFSNDRNALIACFPSLMPMQPGELEAHYGGVILVGYDLRLEKAASLSHLRTDFLIYIAGILIIALVLGLSLHFLITRRLERLRSTMIDFAAGKKIVAPPSMIGDEISQLITRFNEMATTIHKTMEEIRTLNQELEQRVVQRTSQLEAANKELEAFAYSVSHDLRAPLRGIDGFSQVLLDEYQDKVDEQGRNYLLRVRSATQRMAQLIDDLLNLSHVNQIEMNPQQVNLSKIAREIADHLQGSHPERMIEFIIQAGIEVRGDYRLLHIVLENLIGNAWKFTSKQSSALIEFGVQQQSDFPVYFVRDNGAGFDMKYVKKLFGAFQRLHTINEFPGTGVGLATVQRVIHKHGGKVWAQGEVEKGSIFYFTIP